MSVDRCEERGVLKGLNGRNKIQRKKKEIELKSTPGDVSCLLDGRLKMVKPVSMDIYQPPVDVHPEPAPIYQGRQTGRRRRAWLWGR